MEEYEPIICVIGLGYVGLPLAAAFGKSGWKTYGFDINLKRIEALKKGNDWTEELTEEQLRNTAVEYSNDPAIIAKANTVIVAVPTPTDKENKPDLTPVMEASKTVGKQVTKGALIIFESTVYPGVTEEICAPLIEQESGLQNGREFFVGYSPERINPGDKEHTIDKITKVVAGQDDATTERIAHIYEKIIPAGVFRAQNIKTAELAKALENTQRDINIALMNEIARLCDKLGIRTKDVLEAAGTKWNFLPFTPGLVGGHCIGVDPYYLVYKANELGMNTELIAAGRKMNDTMPAFIERQIIGAMKAENINPIGAKVLVLGLTFKENIPDTRNAKVHDLIRGLQARGCDVYGNDPHLSGADIEKLGIKPATMERGTFDVIIAAVMHKTYTSLSKEDIKNALADRGIFYDLKSHWQPQECRALGMTYLSL